MYSSYEKCYIVPPEVLTVLAVAIVGEQDDIKQTIVFLFGSWTHEPGKKAMGNGQEAIGERDTEFLSNLRKDLLGLQLIYKCYILTLSIWRTAILRPSAKSEQPLT